MKRPRRRGQKGGAKPRDLEEMQREAQEAVAAEAPTPKLDPAKVEESHFKPRFDSFFDGDGGRIEDAVKYLVTRALRRQVPRTAPAQSQAEKTETAESEVVEEARHDNATAPAEVRPERGKVVSEVDLLRIRLWRARASHSRQAGLSLVLLSAALFAGAFVTSALIFEIGSIASFVSGVALLAYEAEPRVKLFPSTSSLIGPLKIVDSQLRQHGLTGVQAVFEKAPPDWGAKEVMSFAGGFGDRDAPRHSITPLGEGLVHAYELELGDLSKLGTSGAKVWLPRVMVDGLGLAERVGMRSSGNEITTEIEKPFVRALCVQDFMAEGLCQVSGCPLTASVGQALARASGKYVAHRGCVYNPVTQKATLKDTIEE